MVDLVLVILAIVICMCISVTAMVVADISKSDSKLERCAAIVSIVFAAIVCSIVGGVVIMVVK